MNGAIEQNIFCFIKSHNLVQKGDKLLIAFSGGADSFFALQFFYKFKSKFGVELSALHINHSLRGNESDNDELFCKSVCENLDIQFTSLKIDVKKTAKRNKESIEEAARNIRYTELQKHAKEISAAKIVTAHNLNDNTETILLNLFRGAGLSGASGIPVKRENIIRPLLSTSKEDIIKYLETNNFKFRTDSSNFENDFN
nr:tRNA lysidine(34) synthetase TilS [Melioribacteraceae bacterium]